MTRVRMCRLTGNYLAGWRKIAITQQSVLIGAFMNEFDLVFGALVGENPFTFTRSAEHLLFSMYSWQSYLFHGSMVR